MGGGRVQVQQDISCMILPAPHAGAWILPGYKCRHPVVAGKSAFRLHGK